MFFLSGTWVQLLKGMALLSTSHILFFLICSINFVVRLVICFTSLCVGLQECVGAAHILVKTRYKVKYVVGQCPSLRCDEIPAEPQRS